MAFNDAKSNDTESHLGELEHLRIDSDDIINQNESSMHILKIDQDIQNEGMDNLEQQMGKSMVIKETNVHEEPAEEEESGNRVQEEHGFQEMVEGLQWGEQVSAHA